MILKEDLRSWFKLNALEVAMQDSVMKDCKRLAVNVHYLTVQYQGGSKQSKKKTILPE